MTVWTSLEAGAIRVLLVGDGKGLKHIHLLDNSPAADGEWVSAQPDAQSWKRDPADAVMAEGVRQLSEYFHGSRREFHLPLELDGTPFQQQVWQTLTSIPYGETRSYRWLATRVGRPNAVRAVGAANGSNPLPIVIPCHRVIGSDGSLRGYGGGLGVKRFLLDLERSVTTP